MEQYLTVSALSKYIKVKFERDPYLQKVFIKGELSNYKRHSSGHHYFALKDNDAIIQCMMFSRDANQLNFNPKEGDSVLINGRVSTYESRGNYQLYVNTMTLDGIGLLYEKFERLKQSFFEKGYFNKEHKQSLPKYPKHIAVLTASTGAAVQDIRSTLSKRYPLAKVTYVSTLVQGQGAKENIVKHIKHADNLGCDVIILGRGGGSIEDLWAFNEAEVVEAIYAAKTPIISAVGHETDTTLADFVADLRAPTPTGAAVLATPDIKELLIQIDKVHAYLNRIIQSKVEHLNQSINRLSSYYVLKNPYVLVEQKVQRTDELTNTMKLMINQRLQSKQHNMKQLSYQLSPKFLSDKVRQHQYNISYAQEQMERSIRYAVNMRNEKLKSQLALLSTLSPTEILMRGYSIVRTEEKIIRSVDNVTIDEEITIELSDGKIKSRVFDKKKD